MFIQNGPQTISTQNSNPTSGTPTANSTASIDLKDALQQDVSFQVLGTYTGALTPQVSNNNQNWTTLGGTLVIPEATQTAAATVASGGVGVYRVQVRGHRYFRLSANAAVTGSALVDMIAR